MIAINNQFPGPLIEANWGDWIEVSVTNSIKEPADGTAIHWHGLLQHETPWYDGVPGGKSTYLVLYFLFRNLRRSHYPRRWSSVYRVRR